jgi:hypothetical protein
VPVPLDWNLGANISALFLACAHTRIIHRFAALVRGRGSVLSRSIFVDFLFLFVLFLGSTKIEFRASYLLEPLC